MSQVLHQTHQTLPDDQISPKEVVIKLIAVKNALVRNWKILLICILLGVGTGYILDIYLHEDDNYEARVLFNLGAGGGSMGGMGDIAGMLGMGSSPDANIFTGENFFHFVTSSPVVQRALMKEVEVGNRKVLLANFFIDSSGIRKYEWKDNPKLKNFSFTSNDPSKYTMDQRIALNAVVEKAKVATTVFQPDRKSSFIMLQANSINPHLTHTWINTLLETVEEVYTEEQTRKTRKTLRLLEKRADSLAVILTRTESRLARELDYSEQIVIPEGKVQVNKLSRNSNFLQSLYLESLRNVENLRVSLVRESPLFTIIEPVRVPIDRKSETSKRTQLGFLIGLVVGLLIIYIKGVYTTIMADPRV